MRSRLGLVALALLLLVGAGSGWSPPPTDPPQARALTLVAVAVPCPAGTGPSDGICLAYNGVIPGPTISLNLLDTLNVTLVNHIGQTIWSLPGPPDTKARLANASVSFHIHGMSLRAGEDGLSSAMGGDFQDSYAPPNGSFTYHLRAPYNGTWHYHDHVLGSDGNEGTARGLEGTVAVRAGGDIVPDTVLDIHANDAGAPFVTNDNVGNVVPRGGSFELNFVVLGNGTWTLTLSNFGSSRSLDEGPGESNHFVVDHAAGIYTWVLDNDITGKEYTGMVSAQ